MIVRSEDYLMLALVPRLLHLVLQHTVVKSTAPEEDEVKVHTQKSVTTKLRDYKPHILLILSPQLTEFH